MGGQLLLNEHFTFNHKNQEVKLIGVENWGAGGFKKSGDFQAAIQGLAPEAFKILMSHDPSHWDGTLILLDCSSCFPFMKIDV